jgi:hypothetical protein
MVGRELPAAGLAFLRGRVAPATEK